MIAKKKKAKKQTEVSGIAIMLKAQAELERTAIRGILITIHVPKGMEDRISIVEI